MLVGRFQNGTKGILPISRTPGNASLSLTGYAPAVYVPGVNTLSLNNFNGTDGSKTFTDDIPGITWSTTSGTEAELDTAVKKFGSAAILFSALQTTRVTGGSFTSPHAVDWTIEGWVNISGGDFFRLGGLSSGGAEVIIIDFLITTGSVRMYAQDAGATPIFDNSVAPGAFSASTWYHFALVRNNSGSTYEGFFNGSRLFSESSSTNSGSFVKLTLLTSSITSASQSADSYRVRKAVQYSGASYSVPTDAFIAD